MWQDLVYGTGIPWYPSFIHPDWLDEREALQAFLHLTNDDIEEDEWHQHVEGQVKDEGKLCEPTRPQGIRAVRLHYLHHNHKYHMMNTLIHAQAPPNHTN